MEESFDVVVVGAGPGGYVAAIRAAQLGLKTACIEKRDILGGTCLNVGCIPSKTLLHSSELYAKVQKEGKALGILAAGVSADWSAMQVRKNKVIQELGSGVAGLFKKNKITRIQGEAEFETEHVLKVRGAGEERKISSRFFILATGSEPTALPFLPFDEKKVLSSTGALSLEVVPKRLAVIGAGVIGVELGSVFQRLGSRVTFIEFMDRVCPQFDASLSTALQESLTKQGMEFWLSSKVVSAQVEDGVKLDVQPSSGDLKQIEADAVLVAVGRKAYTKGLGLDAIGISLTPQGLIPIDANFRTVRPHILAIGDVVDGPMLAHKASEEGAVAAELCVGKSASLQYFTIPNVIYTSPEVASVGMTEKEMSERGMDCMVGMYPFRGNSRAKCTGEEEGFVKVLADQKSKRILGVHMIGPHVSELIAEGVLSLGRTLEEVGSVCHAHPTFSECFKEAVLSACGRAVHR